MALSRYCGVSIFVSIYLFLYPLLYWYVQSAPPLCCYMRVAYSHLVWLQLRRQLMQEPHQTAGVLERLMPWLEEMESFYGANRRSKTRTSTCYSSGAELFQTRSHGSTQSLPSNTAHKQPTESNNLHKSISIKKNHIYKLLFHNLVMDYSYSGNKKSITVITHFLKLGFYDHGA